VLVICQSREELIRRVSRTQAVQTRQGLPMLFHLFGTEQFRSQWRFVGSVMGVWIMTEQARGQLAHGVTNLVCAQFQFPAFLPRGGIAKLLLWETAMSVIDQGAVPPSRLRVHLLPIERNDRGGLPHYKCGFIAYCLYSSGCYVRQRTEKTGNRGEGGVERSDQMIYCIKTGEK
jgi:hypothetical protein